MKTAPGRSRWNRRSAPARTPCCSPRAPTIPPGRPGGPSGSRRWADVLSRRPHVLAIEDDHFGDIAHERAGSLLADPRVEDRVIYIRTFSKSIAPDLRLSVAAARPRLKTLLQEAKTHADGWSSRLLQRVLAGVLQDEALGSWLGARPQHLSGATRASCRGPVKVRHPGRCGVAGTGWRQRLDPSSVRL